MEERLAKYNFTPEEIEAFKSNGLVIKCPKKMVLHREGEIPRFFYWVTKGVFRSGFTDKKGNEHTRNFFTADTLPYAVPYGSFATQRPSFSFVEAIEEGEILSWHYDYIQKLENSDIKWLKFFKEELEIIFYLVEHKELRHYTFTPAEQYLAFLNTAPELAARVSQHYIASYIGVSPEALSRIKSRITANKKSKKT
jgi:CRP/FNR family transcriptional regulator, cyclic AMP receptor protein